MPANPPLGSSDRGENGTTGVQSVVDEAPVSDTDVHLHPDPIGITQDVVVVYELVEPTGRSAGSTDSD